MAGGNIEQNVFDVFPPFPVSISLNFVRAALPYYTHETIRFAIARLYHDGVIERVTRRGRFRLARGATRPIDARGGARG